MADPRGKEECVFVFVPVPVRVRVLVHLPVPVPVSACVLVLVPEAMTFTWPQKRMITIQKRMKTIHNQRKTMTSCGIWARVPLSSIWTIEFITYMIWEANGVLGSLGVSWGVLGPKS